MRVNEIVHTNYKLAHSAFSVRHKMERRYLVWPSCGIFDECLSIGVSIALSRRVLVLTLRAELKQSSYLGNHCPSVHTLVTKAVFKLHLVHLEWNSTRI